MGKCGWNIVDLGAGDDGFGFTANQAQQDANAKALAAAQQAWRDVLRHNDCPRNCKTRFGPMILGFPQLVIRRPPRRRQIRIFGMVITFWTASARFQWKYVYFCAKSIAVEAAILKSMPKSISKPRKQTKKKPVKSKAKPKTRKRR